MENIDLLDIVQPAHGWFAIIGIKNGSVQQRLVETRSEADTVIQAYMAQERNVFFGVAKYLTGDSRLKDNVKSLKAFWLDIDCGEDKAVVNPKTGRPQGYIDQNAGLEALKAFCAEVKLPRPTIVNSGRGLHVYWPLTEEISRIEWEATAKRFREVCVQHNFYVDGAVFEVARILRVPGTYNFKVDPPLPVSVLCPSKPISHEEFKSILGGVIPLEDAVPFKPKQQRELSPLAQSLRDNEVKKFHKLMVRSASGNGCQQLLDCFENRETLSELRWFDALSIAKFCDDAPTAIHKMSVGHPDYTPERTEAKIAHIKGPHNCATFERNNPGGCDNCPLKGKITNPIALSKDILRTIELDETEQGVFPDADGVLHRIPKYPAPYFRGANGGIYLASGDEEAEPILIYDYDIYVLKRMVDPNLGDVILLRIHMPKDGIRDLTIPNTTVSDTAEFKKVLSAAGVLCFTTPQLNRVVTYIYTAIKEWQHSKKAEQMRLQFGWADKNSVFVIGDREVNKDGVFNSPPSSVTKELAKLLGPKGTLEKWQEVFNLYGRPGLEPHAFGALTAFGAPLLKFTGQKGAIINLVNSASGTGKTTVLHMCNSVYGNPSEMCSIKEDTLNAKLIRLGTYNNLPYTIDEMTNMSPNEFSTLVYNQTQGRGKDRVKASSNELRINATTWQTITLSSSNASFYEKMSALKATPDGESMRLIEYQIDYSSAIDQALGKEMFDHQLMNNYGHAGLIYAEYLVNNLEEVLNDLATVQAKLDRELHLTQRERFWSAAVAANLTGGAIAARIGLIDWDMRPLYRWSCNLIKDLQKGVRPPPAFDDVSTIIGDYINRHMQSVLVVNDAVDSRSNKPSMPIITPKNELLIRLEPDTDLLYIAVKHFRADCVASQVNYKDVVKQLDKQGVFKGSIVKRMSKGMHINSPGVQCLVFANAGFIDVAAITEGAAPDDGGEG